MSRLRKKNAELNAYVEAVKSYHYEKLTKGRGNRTDCCRKYGITNCFASYMDDVIENGITIENVKKAKNRMQEDRKKYNSGYRATMNAQSKIDFPTAQTQDMVAIDIMLDTLILSYPDYMYKAMEDRLNSHKS